ncbi:MAG: N-acetyltransferase [Paraclostridium sp.]|uniref:N-acetyltransferase n=1 Tax=Paraclostridium sp. TaxID=2023273 RepID=UPI003F3A9FDC
MIRKLEDKDIDTVMSIWKYSTIKAHNFIDKKYWENSYDIVKNVYIPASETFIYEESKEIKGFISILNKEFIGALFIDVNTQGRGIGSKLIDYAIKNYKKLNLAVYKDNKKSVEFYLNKGFDIIIEQVNEDSGFKEYIMEIKI